MEILVVGGGGREHAIVWKLAQSSQVKKIYCVPGNAGTATLAENISISSEDINSLLSLAQEKKIDLTVVGPEAPLAAGIVDVFTSKGLSCFGPLREAARLESSKAFAKEIMKKYKIPTAEGQIFTEIETAISYLKEMGSPVVVKADGLAGGKGVVVARVIEEANSALHSIMVKKVFGNAGVRVVIEECLEGEEVSIMAFTDGYTIIPMISAQDHKRVFDNDEGPNTGGMGAYSPAPVFTEELSERVKSEILSPVISGLRQEGIIYKGVLYVGLMITKEGPKVLEFNARFGDPECQVVLPALKNDLVEVIQAVLDGSLHKQELQWLEGLTACVIMASDGYPGDFKKGFSIYGLDVVEKMEDIFVFHAGTTIKEERVTTTGGRVLGITARGETLKSALDKAYLAVKNISFEGAHYRTDIGWRALK